MDAVAAPFSLWACGVRAVPELAEAIPHGFAAIDAAVGRLARGRRFPNFTGETQADSAGYEADTLERLRRLKRSRDPQGVVRSNKPVLGARLPLPNTRCCRCRPPRSPGTGNNVCLEAG